MENHDVPVELPALNNDKLMHELAGIETNPPTEDIQNLSDDDFVQKMIHFPTSSRGVKRQQLLNSGSSSSTTVSDTSTSTSTSASGSDSDTRNAASKITSHRTTISTIGRSATTCIICCSANTTTVSCSTTSRGTTCMSLTANLHSTKILRVWKLSWKYSIRTRCGGGYAVE